MSLTAKAQLVRAASHGGSVTRIGVTGHMDLTATSVPLVERALRSALAAYADGSLTGVSCIAPGADTIFAEAVLELGGKLEVVLPASDYRTKLGSDTVHAFDKLVEAASDVRTMPHEKSGRDAYHDANDEVMSSCELLFAVWDEGSAHERGGTTAVVAAARARGLPVEVIWPAGAQRRSKPNGASVNGG